MPSSRSLRSLPTVFLVALAGLALVLACTGGAVAGALITGAQIKDGTITSKDVKKGGLTTKNLSKQAQAQLRGQTGPAGPAGPSGPAGPTASAYAENAVPPGTDLNSSDGVAQVVVSTATITTTVQTRLVVTAAITLGQVGTAPIAASCGVWLRAAGAAASTDQRIGALQSGYTTDQFSVLITALGAAERPAGAWTVSLRCGDTVTQPARTGGTGLSVVATAV